MSNPGSFRIEIDAAKSGGVSDPRNGTMLKMFNLLILVNVPAAASQIFSGFGESRGGKNLSLRNPQSRIEPYYRYR